MKATIYGLIAAMALLAVGCSDGLDRVGIVGTVTYQGEPLSGAEILFRPEFGPNSGATSDDSGKFEVNSQLGPTSGKCEIRVMKTMVPAGEQYERNVLPKTFSEEPKIVTFESGQNELELNLDDWK